MDQLGEHFHRQEQSIRATASRPLPELVDELAELCDIDASTPRVKLVEAFLVGRGVLGELDEPYDATIDDDDFLVWEPGVRMVTVVGTVTGVRDDPVDGLGVTVAPVWPGDTRWVPADQFQHLLVAW